MALDPNSESALKTVDIQQAVIARMSAASASAKNWCVTVVSAVAIVAVDKEKWTLALIAVVPTVLFLVIDLYYLSLERSVRNAHESFVERLRNGTAETDSLFDVGTVHLSFWNTITAFKSKSIWPFYLFIFLSLVVVGLIAGGK